MSDELEWLNEVKNHLGEYVYFWNGGIATENFNRFASEVTSNLPTTTDNTAYLVLTTSGGQADSAYQSIRLLHEIFSRVVVVVPTYCKSAGTLMVLGAHQLQMSIIAELGPLDVQIRETDELFSMRSGLNSSSAFSSLSEQSYELFADMMLKIKQASNNAISFRLSSEIAAKVTCELMSPIYAQLNPRAIGSDYRKLHTATAYGERLSEISKNLKSGTLMKLVSGYPDHGFVIDFREASQLFKNIQTPNNIIFAAPKSLNFLISPNSNGDCIYGVNTLLEEFTPDDAAEEDKANVKETSSESSKKPAKKVGKKAKGNKRPSPNSK